MINKIYKTKYFPLVFQLISLVVFFLIVIGSLGISTEDSVLAKQLRNTNLSNLIVWSYWWPIIIITSVLFGRHWCTICPVELTSAIATKFGLNRKVPKFIKTGWIITIIYALIAVIAIHTLAIHRQPHRMAWYLITLMASSLLISLFYEKRAFCSYFCPVGKLLGLYALLASWGIRVKKSTVCNACMTKECISIDLNNKIIGRSCTSNLYPPKISDNRECISCTQCIKVCPNDNIEYNRTNDLNSVELSPAEVGMVSILLGFVSYEILSSWKVSKLFLLGPSNYLYSTGLFSFLPEGTFNALILFVFSPILLLTIFAFLHKTTTKQTFSFALAKVAYAVLPVIAFGHVFKAALKMSSRIPYWKYALDDPKGMEYANDIVNKTALLEEFPLIDSLVVGLGMTMLLLATLWAVKRIWKHDNPLISKLCLTILVVGYLIFLEYGPITDLLN